MAIVAILILLITFIIKIFVAGFCLGIIGIGAFAIAFIVAIPFSFFGETVQASFTFGIFCFVFAALIFEFFTWAL